MCDEKWDGKTERRNGFCPMHHLKAKEQMETDTKVDELEKSKVSFKVLQMLIAIILSIGGIYWYNQDTVSKARFNSLMEKQINSTKAMELHIGISNIILRNMSRDVREMKLNLRGVLKKQNLEYQTIPDYYGPKE